MHYDHPHICQRPPGRGPRTKRKRLEARARRDRLRLTEFSSTDEPRGRVIDHGSKWLTPQVWQPGPDHEYRMTARPPSGRGGLV